MMDETHTSLQLGAGSVLRSLRQLQLHGSLCDLLIYSREGSSIPVHRCMMAAASSTFMSVPDTHIIKTTACAETINTIVAYLYGEQLALVSADLKDATLACLEELGLLEVSKQISQNLGSVDAETSPVSDGKTDELQLHVPCKVENPQKETPQPREVRAQNVDVKIEDETESNTEYSDNEDANPSNDESGTYGKPDSDISTTPGPTDLQEEVQNPVTPYRFPCSLCDKKLATEHSMHRHQQFVHSMKYSCGMCRATFDTISQVRKHQRKCITETDSVEETHDEGNVKVFWPKRFEEEKILRQVRKRHVCEDCGFAFVTAFSLKTHRLKYCHKQTCHKCGSTFRNKLDLKSHCTGLCPALDPSEKQRKHPCFCGKKFFSKMCLRQHERKVHKLTYSCLDCKSSFNSQWKLNRHRRLIHGEKRRKPNKPPIKHPYMCPDCGKVYATESYGKSHYQREHQGIGNGPFLCQDCGASFRSKSGLKRHVIVKHTVKDAFICDQCGREFSRAPLLNLHKRVIHEGRRVVCACGQSFRWAVSRKRHEKYQCPLTEDSRTPDMKGKHECDDCGIRFRDKRAMRMHEKQVHNKMYPCKKCSLEFPSIKLLKLHRPEHRSRRLN